MTNWTKNDMPDLYGKIFIVTGANSGLGYESSLALAEKGATVIMACRNLERAQLAGDTIMAAVPAAKLELIELNLASLKSINTFADSFKNKFDQLDAVINNGGIMGSDRSETEDGFESQFGVNHLGHFALTGLLLDVLQKTPSSRIVTVSSRMHVDGIIAWDDLMGEHSYERWTAYRQSQLAKLLFAFELGRRLEATGSATKSIAIHPGLAATNWTKNNLDGFMRIVMGFISKLASQSAALGSLSQLYAAVDPGAKNGGYYGPEHDKKGYPVEAQANDAAYDEMDAQRLWETSEELTNVKFDALK